jgi:hypothetical protein
MNNLEGGRHPCEAGGVEVLCHNLAFLKKDARIWIVVYGVIAVLGLPLPCWSTCFLYEGLAMRAVQPKARTP